MAAAVLAAARCAGAALVAAAGEVCMAAAVLALACGRVRVAPLDRAARGAAHVMPGTLPAAATGTPPAATSVPPVALEDRPLPLLAPSLVA
eukprot:592358-Lingulodinium_polyedra.AAC.1